MIYNKMILSWNHIIRMLSIVLGTMLIGHILTYCNLFIVNHPLSQLQMCFLGSVAFSYTGSPNPLHHDFPHSHQEG